ncbi:probable protein phosphatase DDB_G0282105 [Trifolium pratense]|uniref:probable protein phosphatase DDB_G0282105 n=1 Tax=Trifolium pratense TaxID=57577 RepID=UPI001E691530|nr:probable protein phosphatase DDB_G0282105 [Trifolium pratense]
MASESVESLVTPDVTKSPEVKVRRNSAGNARSGNGDEKVVPNYLRASTGSCHDLCKYGGEHAFVSKRSIPNRATRKKIHQSSEASIGQVIAKSKPPVDSKPTKMSTDVLKDSVDSKPTKMLTVVHKESVDSKTQIPDALDINAHELPSKSFDSQKHVANEVKVNRKKASSVEVKPSSFLLKFRTSPSTSQEISSSTDKEVQSQSKSTPVKVENLSKSTTKKVENTSKPTSKVKTSSKSTDGPVEAVSKSTLKMVENTSKVKTSSKSTSKSSGTSSQLSSLNGKEIKLSAKHSAPLNSNRVAKKKVSSSMNSSEGFDDKIISEIKTEKKVASSKTVSRKPITPIKALSSPRASLKRVSSLNSRNHKSLKIVSHLRNQKTAKEDELEEHNNNNINNNSSSDSNNEVEERTLYVIKTESEEKTLQSDQTASYDDESYLPQLSTPMSSSTSVTRSLSDEDEESEYTTSEFEVDSLSGINCEIECMENEEALKVEKKSKPRKVKEVEDKDCEMIKLKFRRGKVVDKQIEKNTPRRLTFRRAKTLAEKANVNNNSERKSFKKRDEACSESNGGGNGQEKVVLRHQDVEDKKDAQGLFNNVIEETASKLVEARKSKVKALVGAFETVISLQDKKPSANIVS